jgi:hypothetical protein
MRFDRRRHPPLIALALVAGSAVLWSCTSVTGVNDLELADLPSAEPSSEPAPPEPTTKPTQSATRVPDAAPTADAEPEKDAAPDVLVLPKPTYCDHSLLASFEDALTTEDGTAPTLSSNAQFTYEAGRYGKAVRGAAQLFYPVTNNVQYRPTQGSMSFWIKPSFTLPLDPLRIFFRPKSRVEKGGSSTGYSVQTQNQNMRLEFSGLGGGTEISHGLLTGWSTSSWTHVVATWFNDGNNRSFILYVRTDGMTTHAKANDGDNTSTNTTTSFVRLGIDEVASPDAYDDFALWPRVLTAAEVTELYASPQSIRQRCEVK